MTAPASMKDDDGSRRLLATSAEIAAFLGVSSSAIRQVIRRKRIKARGVGEFGSKLYDPREVLKHTGSADRRPVWSQDGAS